MVGLLTQAWYSLSATTVRQVEGRCRSGRGEQHHRQSRSQRQNYCYNRTHHYPVCAGSAHVVQRAGTHELCLLSSGAVGEEGDDGSPIRYAGRVPSHVGRVGDVHGRVCLLCCRCQRGIVHGLRHLPRGSHHRVGLECTKVEPHIMEGGLPAHHCNSTGSLLR